MINNPQREVALEAPIPGHGLTAPLGGRPWQQPPQFTTVEQAIEFYTPKIMDEKFGSQLLDVIELGVPLTVIANALQTSSVMEGKHTIDVGILVLPVLVELMITLAEANEVPYKTGMESQEDTSISETQIALAEKKGLFKPKDKPTQMPEREAPQEVLQEEEGQMGLMTRRGS